MPTLSKKYFVGPKSGWFKEMEQDTVESVCSKKMHADCVLGNTIKNMESCQITLSHGFRSRALWVGVYLGVEEQVFSLPEIDSRI